MTLKNCKFNEKTTHQYEAILEKYTPYLNPKTYHFSWDMIKNQQNEDGWTTKTHVKSTTPLSVSWNVHQALTLTEPAQIDKKSKHTIMMILFWTLARADNVKSYFQNWTNQDVHSLETISFQEIKTRGEGTRWIWQ